MLTGTITPSGTPSWTRGGAIGDIGGAADKKDSATEANIPYAWQVYRELQAQRGSAYSPKTSGTLVHCEHLALARTLSATFFRAPEKLRANATPRGSDERLEYWAKILGIPFGPNDPRWLIRQRCVAAYQAAIGPTIDNLSAALTSLLGTVFVSLVQTTGSDLANPPEPTKWPGIDPGPPSYSLSDPTISGYGAWFSSRCHLVVNVQQPTGMSDTDFFNLLDVQMFHFLDSVLPAWATFNWSVGTDFLLDISRLDLTGMGT